MSRELPTQIRARLVFLSENRDTAERMRAAFMLRQFCPCGERIARILRNPKLPRPR